MALSNFLLNLACKLQYSPSLVVLLLHILMLGNGNLPWPVKSNQERKRVFAHFMVGNTYPYTVDDWLADIELASTHDIDGFVLNVGRESWQKDRVSDCFDAVSRVLVPFRLFLSFDMSSLPAHNKEDVYPLQDYVASFAHHPNMFQFNGKVVISTFSGENSLFGYSTLDDAWTYVKIVLGEITPIYFIPSFFIDPALYPEIKAMDGVFNWNGGWPLHLRPNLPRREIENPKLDTDQHHIRHLDGRTFMAAVSPWFFTHYGSNSWNKNWIYRGDDWLFVRRWEQLIDKRDQVDIVQVISWNDYGESHYIAPVRGAQPNSQAWVDGFPHDAWLRLNQYYARAFQDGSYPPIDKDQIYMWARPHPRDADAPDPVPRPNNFELTDDVLWVVVFAVAPAKVKLYITDKDKREYDVPAGVTRLSRPLRAEGLMRAKLKRAGLVFAECSPQTFRFERKPTVYNFNAFVAMSP